MRTTSSCVLTGGCVFVCWPSAGMINKQASSNASDRCFIFQPQVNLAGGRVQHNTTEEDCGIARLRNAECGLEDSSFNPQSEIRSPQSSQCCCCKARSS